ncbi:MAG TPA: endolytic transglycosylase MltG [Mycobacteriales bacterium]|nr:endolytic transglycosylase MltG [Mycobacteriales bacterium]
MSERPDVGVEALMVGQPRRRRSGGNRNDGSGGPPSGRRAGVVLLALVVFTVIGVGALVGLGYGVSRVFAGSSADYKGSGTGSVEVQIETGDSAGDIAAELHAAGVVKSDGAFTDAASKDTRSREIQPGYYLLRSHMSGKAALALLLDPKSRESSRIVIPEGFTAKQVLARLAARTTYTAQALQAAADNPLALGVPAYAQGHPIEGFLFPATYDVPPHRSAGEVLTMMVNRFTVAAEAVGLVDGAKALSRSPYEVLTVASLIQAEAAPADFAKVSEVIYNRLKDGTPLGLEATERYALGSPSDANLTVSQLAQARRSPYSTQQRAGLPAGPIDNPGQAALEAALHPAQGDLFYYLTLPQTHVTKFFSKSDHQGFLDAEAECRSQGGCGG